MNKIIIFVGESHGESERTHEPYHVYKFNQLFVDEKTNVVKAKVVDLFAKRPIQGTKSIDFGAVVKLTFEDSDEIGGKPNLTAVEVVNECPYIALLV